MSIGLAVAPTTGMEILRAEQRVMQAALEVRSTRAELLASNVANADTPGYIARDIKFDDALDRMLENGNQETATAESAISAENLRYDRNDVDVSQQLAKSYENSLNYVAILKLYGDSMGRMLSAASSG